MLEVGDLSEDEELAEFRSPCSADSLELVEEEEAVVPACSMMEPLAAEGVGVLGPAAAGEKLPPRPTPEREDMEGEGVRRRVAAAERSEDALAIAVTSRSPTWGDNSSKIEHSEYGDKICGGMRYYFPCLVS